MKRINTINILRIIFMLMILTFHAMVNYNAFTGWMPLDKFISKGAVAVTGFFMISGFTLRYSYEERVKDIVGILKYMKNRIIGIFPAYVFLLAVSFVWHFRLKETLFETIALLPVELTLSQTFYYIQLVMFAFNDNFWYVSVAFFLYLIFPGLNWVASQIKKPIPWIIILTLFSEYIYWISIKFPVIVETYYYINPIFRIPEFFVGILVCDLVKKHHARIRWFVWVLATIIYMAIFLAMYMPLIGYAQNYNLFNIIVIPYVAILLIACASAPDWLERVSGSKPVTYLAGLGLTMYLCQSIPFAMKEGDYLHLYAVYEKVPAVVMFYILTITSSILINALIERPVKMLFRRDKSKGESSTKTTLEEERGGTHEKAN